MDGRALDATSSAIAGRNLQRSASLSTHCGATPETTATHSAAAPGAIAMYSAAEFTATLIANGLRPPTRLQPQPKPPPRPQAQRPLSRPPARPIYPAVERIQPGRHFAPFPESLKDHFASGPAAPYSALPPSVQSTRRRRKRSAALLDDLGVLHIPAPCTALLAASSSAPSQLPVGAVVD